MDSWSGIILPGAVGVDCCPNQTVYLWIFFVLFVIFCFCFFPQTHNWLFEKPFPVFFFLSVGIQWMAHGIGCFLCVPFAFFRKRSEARTRRGTTGAISLDGFGIQDLVTI